MQYKVRFDCERFRHDVLTWIQRFNAVNGRGGREHLKVTGKLSSATLSRLLDDPGKLESVHALLTISNVCGLDFMSYSYERRRDYIFVGDY